MTQIKNSLLIAASLMVTMLLNVPAYGQSYSLFNSDRKMTFARLSATGADSIYYFLKIDSFTTAGADTTLYFNNQLRQVTPADPFCEFIENDTVILGSKVLIQSDTDRTHVFFNYLNDSIFIHTQIKVGDTWKLYKWPNGSYVKATVINKLQGELLPGAIDSFYRIKLNVFTLGGTMLPDTFPNDTKIDISQTLGIVEFFNFHIFPQPGDSLARVLRGLSDPDIGVVDIDAQTAFDFELGYEFHFREEIVPDLVSGADKRISAWKYFVLNKSVDEIGATYTMNHIQFDTLYFAGSPTSTMVWDTVTVSYAFDDYRFLDTLEFNVFDANQFGYSDWIIADSMYDGVPVKEVFDWYSFDETTDCLSNPENLSNPVQIYGDGLGTIFYLDSLVPETYYKLEMVYFKQGLRVYGTPFDFSILDNAIHDRPISEQITVYPNPCSNILILPVAAKNYLSLQITDLTGREIQIIQDGNPTIDVKHLDPGIYYLNIITTNSILGATFVKL